MNSLERLGSSSGGGESYGVVVGRGYIRVIRSSRLQSKGSVWPDREPLAEEFVGGVGGWKVSAESGRQGAEGLSARSGAAMRRLFMSLPWEMLGARPAIVTLTYPGDWRPWVPDAATLEAHRRAFAERWRRRWGPLLGVWVKEFQTLDGRPHIHLYVGLPGGMSDGDYRGFRARTLLRKKNERRYGVREGRARLAPIGMAYGGEMAMWLRQSWAEVVGTTSVPLKEHHRRGVDVGVMFFSDRAEQTADRVRVAEYLSREAGKQRQKEPPRGFCDEGGMRYYGTFGRKEGFVPDVTAQGLEAAVALELASRLHRWVAWKMHVGRGAETSS